MADNVLFIIDQLLYGQAYDVKGLAEKPKYDARLREIHKKWSKVPYKDRQPGMEEVRLCINTYIKKTDKERGIANDFYRGRKTVQLNHWVMKDYDDKTGQPDDLGTEREQNI